MQFGALKFWQLNISSLTYKVNASKNGGHKQLVVIRLYKNMFCTCEISDDKSYKNVISTSMQLMIFCITKRKFNQILTTYL